MPRQARFDAPGTLYHVIIRRIEKKAILRKILFVVAILYALTGCVWNRATNSAPQFHATSDGSIELQFPADWYENKEKHPYDLQYLSPGQQMVVGLFVYKKEDLAADMTPRELLQTQIEDIKSKRKNFQVLEGETVVQHGGKKLTTVTYTGEKEASKFCYRFTLIEFGNTPELLAIALQTAFPSSWSEDKPILDEIVKSARVKARNRLHKPSDGGAN